MEPSNWIQERSPRSKGNKYREKYCAEQAEAFALNRHQKLYLLGADCVTFDWLSAPEAENTLARKVFFPFIQSLIMWPDFCLLNLSCSQKVKASRIFFFAVPTKAVAWGRCRMQLHLLQLLSESKLLQRHWNCRAGCQIVFVCLSSLRAELQASIHSWFLIGRPWPPHL